MSSSQCIVDRPWMVLGDFNQVLHLTEHSTLVNQNADRRLREFRECLRVLELVDLNFRGNTYTLWNKCKTRPVAKKLDRVLVNDTWSVNFPSSYVIFGEPDFSDHASCGVVLGFLSQRQKRSFKFFNYLLQKFLPMVCNHWFSCNVVGSAMLRLSKKFKLLKKMIRGFSRDNYSNLEKRVFESHEALLHLQNQTLGDPSQTNVSLELEAHRRWLILVKAEEAFFCQRSRICWLQEGDMNTTYYHIMTQSRMVINHIHFLIAPDGSRLDSRKHISDHCVEYYTNLMDSVQSPQMLIQEDMDLLLPYRCSESQKEGLLK